ncbi:MAG: DJ-1/PfpI family protein [Ignavibacteriaceae bacterium]|nr:DJ-1/PfpI family protein [Ignavibacteriaceae bacterium]
MNNPAQNSYLIFLPKKDFNEEEFTIIKKRLLKAGKQVFITSDDHLVCSGSKGMKVKSDTSFYNVNVNNFIAFILIGGSGSKAYWKNDSLHKIVKKFFDAKKVIAAICSSPITLAKAGILQNKKATCYTEDKMELINHGIDYQDKNVVIDGNIVTSDNSRSALQFAEAVLHLTK